jgi:putative heme-binding domain-containing protein
MLPKAGCWLSLVLCTLFAVPAGAEDFPLVVETEPLSPSEQQKQFHLPPGFEIQLVAAEPDVRKPINMNFDNAGRLYFTQSVEYPFAVAAGKTGRDTVRRIEGIGPDGRAARVRPVVEGLNIPIGVLPLPDRLIVFSIPNIYTCRDTDGDGVYESREVLLGPFDRRDTHGLNNGFTRGLDGWIYACHGFSNDSHVKGRDGNEVHMNSGNTYRFRADGSRIEHYTHGQVNPFGLCFDSAGNLFSADCHTMPAYMLLRGAYYPSFGKPHDGLGFGPEIMRHSHGSTAIAGIVVYNADQFPPEYRDTLFIGNPVTHRINHDRLEWDGSSPTAVEQSDFLKCDDPWFRPVDVKLGPDGALYIADFYNCIIGHYEVDLHHPRRDRERGRIWRVVYRGTNDKPAKSPAISDLTKLDLDALLGRLNDSNLVVRTMATHEILDRFAPSAGSAITKLLKSGRASARQRAQAAWILSRATENNEPLLPLVGDQDGIVRANAVRALAAAAGHGKSPREMPTEIVVRAIRDDDATVRRAAVESFGCSRVEMAPSFLDAWRSADAADVQLIHAIRIALRDCFARPGSFEAWAHNKESRSGDNRRRIADISLGIPSAEAGDLVLHYIEDEPDAARFPEMLAHAVRYLPAERLTDAFKLVDRLQEQPLGKQRGAVTAFHEALTARGTPVPENIVAWANRVAATLIATGRERPMIQGVELARTMKLSAVRPQLEELAAASRFTAVRPIAIDACVACDPAGSVPFLAHLAADAHEATPLRQKAAQALGAINNDAAHHEILSLLARAPASLAADLASGLANAQSAGLLLTAIENGKASVHVLTSPQVALRLKQIARDDLQQRIARLVESLPAVDEAVRTKIAERIAGYSHAPADASAGMQVFTKTCAVCHRIDGAGAKIGPDLDGIGNRGLERLVEDVLDPSRNVDQAFRTTLITTDDGQAVSGLVLREEGKVLVLADNQGKEVRLPLDKVAERTVSPISPMPANVVEQLGEQDFYNLVAYLLSSNHAKD